MAGAPSSSTPTPGAEGTSSAPGGGGAAAAECAGSRPLEVAQRDTKRFWEAVSLLTDTKARFASTPFVYQELHDLLTDFRHGDITDGTARATAILEDQPDLLARFNELVCQVTIKPADEDATVAPRRRCRNRNQRPAASAVDPRDAKVKPFLERLKGDGSVLYERTMALLRKVGTEVNLDAHEIYSLAGDIYRSSANSDDLLREFAQFLPTEHDLPAEERRPARKRKATAVADTGKTTTTNSRSKRRRRETEDQAAHCDTNVSPFRQFWEFDTRYSKLVSTMKRTKKLLKAYKHKKGPDAGDSPDFHRRRLTFQDIYTTYESREVLERLYGSHWEAMEEALEDSNRRGVALKVILARLRKQEDIAVKAAMERRDPKSVESRLRELVREKVMSTTQRTGINHPIIATIKITSPSTRKLNDDLEGIGA